MSINLSFIKFHKFSSKKLIKALPIYLANSGVLNFTKDFYLHYLSAQLINFFVSNILKFFLAKSTEGSLHIFNIDKMGAIWLSISQFFEPKFS